MATTLRDMPDLAADADLEHVAARARAADAHLADG